MTAPTNDEPVANIIRFEAIGERKSHYRPREMLLPRFERERFSVIGRPGEGSTKGKALGDVKAFSVVYLRCQPGKGLASHAHASAEVFVVMSCQWEIDVEGTKTMLNPFDVISVPPDMFHGARDIGPEPAVMMVINEGQAGVPISLDTAISQEIAAAGHVVSDPEYHPGARA